MLVLDMIEREKKETKTIEERHCEKTDWHVREGGDGEWLNGYRSMRCEIRKGW